MANLSDTVMEMKSFSSLVQAVATAGLEEFLKSPGPLTLLAPTDEAFGQLSQADRDALLADAGKLKRVLMYHILPGDVRSDDLAEIDEAPTEEGSIVAVERSNDAIKINDAQVVQTDILTDNGVIHVINQVLMPGILEDNLSS